MRLRFWQSTTVRLPDDAHDLCRAVVAYLGFGAASAPQRDRSRLRRAFSTTHAAALEADVMALLKELAAVDIDWSAHTLASAGRFARASLGERHPELCDRALDALEWKCTFDWM